MGKLTPKPTESGHHSSHCAVNHNPWSMKKNTDVPFLPLSYQTERARFRSTYRQEYEYGSAKFNQGTTLTNLLLFLLSAMPRWQHNVRIQNGKEMKFTQVCLDLFEGHCSGCSSNDTHERDFIFRSISSIHLR